MATDMKTALRRAWLTGLVVAVASIAPRGLPAQEGVPPEAQPAPTVVPASADTTEDRRGPSPMGAFFRSVVLPGWGQFYSDQEVRGIVYSVVHAASLFMVVRTNNRVHDTDDESLQEARRNQREDWLVWAGFWALASGVDAWVSAQMWSFEGEVVPPPDGSAGVALRLTVPVGGF